MVTESQVGGRTCKGPVPCASAYKLSNLGVYSESVLGLVNLSTGKPSHDRTGCYQVDGRPHLRSREDYENFSVPLLCTTVMHSHKNTCMATFRVLCFLMFFVNCAFSLGCGEFVCLYHCSELPGKNCLRICVIRNSAHSLLLCLISVCIFCLTA